MLNAVGLAVFGSTGGGEYGSCLVEEDGEGFVAVAEMCEQQFVGVGIARHGGSLCGGAVQFVGSHVGKVVGKGALHAEQVDIAHTVGKAVEIASVAAVGVATRNPLAMRFLLDDVAKRIDRMTQCYGVHAAFSTVKDHLAAAIVEGGVPQFVVVDGELYMRVGCAGDGLQHLANTLRTNNIDRGLAPTDVHGGEQPRQPKEMVAMEMRYADEFYRLQPLMAMAYLVLRALATVYEHTEASHIDHLRATMTRMGRYGGTRAKNGDIEIGGHALVFCDYAS